MARKDGSLYSPLILLSVYVCDNMITYEIIIMHNPVYVRLYGYYTYCTLSLFCK